MLPDRDIPELLFSKERGIFSSLLFCCRAAHRSSWQSHARRGLQAVSGELSAAAKAPFIPTTLPTQHQARPSMPYRLPALLARDGRTLPATAPPHATAGAFRHPRPCRTPTGTGFHTDCQAFPSVIEGRTFYYLCVSCERRALWPRFHRSAVASIDEPIVATGPGMPLAGITPIPARHHLFVKRNYRQRR